MTSRPTILLADIQPGDVLIPDDGHLPCLQPNVPVTVKKASETGRLYVDCKATSPHYLATTINDGTCVGYIRQQPPSPPTPQTFWLTIEWLNSGHVPKLHVTKEAAETHRKVIIMANRDDFAVTIDGPFEVQPGGLQP